MSRSWQALRALRLRLFGPAKELVGTDQFGNKYYRVPEHEARAGQIVPERRFVEAINRQAYQYEMGDFPTEWEAWIRKKRKDPPTIENWPQHSALGNTACDRPPTGFNSIYHNSLGLVIQTVFHTAKSTPIQAMSSQFLQENAVGNRVKGFTEVQADNIHSLSLTH
ncbi:NADH dehydrogenase [ubiquinone] 1 alpha subcomplex assembly factor 2 isoform X2 [Mycteria americana]|uniref:NADH dehydrogenase [ubiquinone] 1 alpha subcomplex assembly factor 2 isoform X2 n=1 Tax=Mycteria americana TaxID=33587 RepID=UPI003F58F4AB